MYTHIKMVYLTQYLRREYEPEDNYLKDRRYRYLEGKIAFLLGIILRLGLILK